MVDHSFLEWPFFEDHHRQLVRDLDPWVGREIGSGTHDENHLDKTCRDLLAKLASGGWLRYTVPKSFGGVHEPLDVRSICLVRETIARYSGLAEFIFAMQGLGSGPISQFGSDSLKRRYLPKVASGEAMAAFAISETESGSDVGSMQTAATLDGNGYVINGEKTWISNAGIADFYVVFCRLEGQDKKKFIALVVDASNPGLRVTRRIPVIAPHPLGTLKFENCRVNADAVVGEPGKGLGVALGTLDIFRSTVGAAALGLAKCALEKSVEYAQKRSQFGAPLADFQLVQAKIADMATRTEASALLVYRAAWKRDTSQSRITREAAMAKLYSTESAQQTIDDAVQIFGGRGVVSGETVERLYREIRALRIYEGTSEIQKLVIAKNIFEAAAGQRTAPHV